MPFDNPNANPSGANYRAVFADLCSQLPPRLDEDPEALADRRQRAMDALVALVPYDDFEAELAIRIIAANSHAADALRSVALVADNPDRVRQCRAQAASMMRQSDAALRSLLRLQERREKLEAAMHPAAMEKAGYWFKSISVQAAPAQPPPEPPPDNAEPVRTQARIDADAELYAIMYPDRAARIRAAGGLPPRLDFGPPEPEIVAALLRKRVPAQPTAPSGSADQDGFIGKRDNETLARPGDSHRLVPPRLSSPNTRTCDGSDAESGK
jgi:hypothetical protein